MVEKLKEKRYKCLDCLNEYKNKINICKKCQSNKIIIIKIFEKNE